MSAKSTLALIAIGGTLLGILSAIDWHIRLPRNVNTDARNETSFLTTPLAALPPHRHDAADSPEDPGHGVYVQSETIVIPEDLWITDITPVVHNAPYWTLHHMDIESLDTKNIVCPNLNEVIFIVGSDVDGTISLPKPYGIFMKKGARIRVSGMLHNPQIPMGSGETFENVQSGFTVTVAKPKERSKKVSFYLMEIDDQPHCADNYEFTVPPLTQSFIKASDTTNLPNMNQLSFPFPWTIVGIGAHLHAWQGGKRLQVFQNQTLIRDFFPTRVSISPEIWRSPTDMTEFTVPAGDMISLKTEYENTTNQPIDGAMGVIGIYYHIPDITK